MKKFNIIGCCGIDCGLCPAFHTKGDSVCPGCGGLGFKEKHPSCGFVTCCVNKKGFEVCSDCPEYPCKRFDAEHKGYDSFVTHKKVFENLDFIRLKGIDCFMDRQKIRMNILEDFLANYNDGRSKSFFCLSCALLPLEKLEEEQLAINQFKVLDPKVKNRRLKDSLQLLADNLKIDLKLNHQK